MIKIAVTGSAGLIGRGLLQSLKNRDIQVVCIDTAEADPCDITDRAALASRLTGCQGVVHLAAVSRVAEAEEFPARTWQTNVAGTEHLLSALVNTPQTERPWLIHASSREVYGDQPAVAISEDTAFSPLNIYGRSKTACEYLVQCAVDAGVNASILRFANVYGDTGDYTSRVIPAFARAAVSGNALRVDDASTCMDFTHVSDVADGIVKTIDLLLGGETGLPPIRFATGHGTSLGELAAMAVEASNGRCIVNEGERRASSVSCFIGNPARATDILGWVHNTPLSTGFSQLVSDFQKSGSGS